MKEAQVLYSACVEACLDEDDETAHAKEDELRQLALTLVLDEHPEAMEVVKLALSTQQLEFMRNFG